MDIAVEQAGEADLAELVRLFDGYRRFYGQPTDLERAHGFIAERLSRGDSLLLIARAGDRALGFAQLFPSFSSIRTGRLWILNDLFVEPGARQRGAGRALMEAGGPQGPLGHSA